jgi:hypothetical protein
VVLGMSSVYTKPGCIGGWCEGKGWLSRGVVAWFVVVGLTKGSWRRLILPAFSCFFRKAISSFIESRWWILLRWGRG